MPRRGKGAERNVALTEQNRRFRTETFQQRAWNRDLLDEDRQHDQRECRGRPERDAPAPAAGEPDETSDQRRRRQRAVPPRVDGAECQRTPGEQRDNEECQGSTF